MATATHAAPLPGQPKYSRKTLIVNWGFQLRAVLPLLFFAAFYAALLGGLLLVPLYRSLAAEPDLGVRVILRAQLRYIQFHLWLLMGVAALLTTYYAWRRSLRVAGPLHRLHRTLIELAEGEYKPLQFREGDEFRVFEEDIAQLNQKMKLIATRNRDILFAVHAHVKKLADRLAADEIIPRADLEEAVRAMLAQLGKAPEISLGARR